MGGYFDGERVFWNVRADRPLPEEELALQTAKAGTLHCIQIQGPAPQAITRPSRETMRILRERFFAPHPHIELRIFLSETVDLSVLEEVPMLERLAVEARVGLLHPEALRGLTSLHDVSFELPKKTPNDLLTHLAPSVRTVAMRPSDRTSADVDLAPLLRLEALTALHLDAYERDLEAVLPRLSGLQTLTLRSAKKLAHLQAIAGLSALRHLTLQQLGAVGSLEVLAALPDLRTLSLWRLPKVTDFTVLSSLVSLEVLSLETLPTMTRFPETRRMRALRIVRLAAMKLLRDFSALEHAPALEELVFQKADAQRPEDFIPVLANPSLVRAGFGFHKKADVARMEELARARGIDAEVYMYPQIRGSTSL